MIAIIRVVRHAHRIPALSVGRKIVDAAMQYYVIKSGDTLSKIAAKYHTSVNTLCRLNGMTVNTKLQIGKRIRVK